MEDKVLYNSQHKKLYEKIREIIADYTKRKGDVICVETLAPENSKYKEYAQTASTIVLALPNELSIEKNKELLEEFINTRFTNRDLISTYAIHNNEGNLHAHIQTTRRTINEETND